MIIVKFKENIIKFVMCTVILLLAMLIISKLLNKPTAPVQQNDVSTSVIEFEDDKTKIYVEYPRFYGDDKVNQIIGDALYNYIKKFRESDNTKLLDMSYEVKHIFNLVNVEFNIQDSSNLVKNMNLLFDLKNQEQKNISDIYDKELLQNEIYTLVNNKYSTDVYNEVVKNSIDDYTYVFEDEEIDVYFNNINLTNLDNVPNVSITLSNPKNEEENDPNIKKYVAFTYEDGPSQYTKDISTLLEGYDSSATFFMLGSKMSNNDDIILQVLSSGNEIGSHGYDDNSYLFMTNEELNEELNKTNDIYKSITNKNLILFRPPYGKYNNDILNTNYKTVLWSLESKDWLLQDEEQIFNNIISSVSDGAIIKFQDCNEYTYTATEKLLPELNRMGYEVVSVSKLMEIKKYVYKKEAISYIK